MQIAGKRATGEMAWRGGQVRTGEAVLTGEVDETEELAGPKPLTRDFKVF
jgi:hypothetical protein